MYHTISLQPEYNFKTKPLVQGDKNEILMLNQELITPHSITNHKVNTSSLSVLINSGESDKLKNNHWKINGKIQSNPLVVHFEHKTHHNLTPALSSAHKQLPKQKTYQMIDYVWARGVASRIAEPFTARWHIATNDTRRVRNPTVPTRVLGKIRLPVLKSLHIIARLLKTQPRHPLHNLTSTSITTVVRSSFGRRWRGRKRIRVAVVIVMVMVIRGRRCGPRIWGSGRSRRRRRVHRKRIGRRRPRYRGAKFGIGVEIGLALGVEFEESVGVGPGVRLRRRFK